MIAGIILSLWLLSIPVCILINLLRGIRLGPCLWIAFIDAIVGGPIVGIICYFSWKDK